MGVRLQSVLPFLSCVAREARFRPTHKEGGLGLLYLLPGLLWYTRAGQQLPGLRDALCE